MSKSKSGRLDRKVQLHVEWLLTHYAEMKKENAAPNFEQITGERLAYNAMSIKAIERALKKADAIDMELLKLVYWRKTHTVDGAGQKVGLSKSAAYRRLNRIFRDIALEMGLVSL